VADEDVDVVEVADPDGSADHDPVVVRRPRRGSAEGSRFLAFVRAAVFPVLLVVICSAAIGLHLRAYTKISTIDELQYSDYVISLAEGNGIVDKGDYYTKEFRAEAACRGLELEIDIGRCGRPRGNGAYPFGGFNSAFIHTPAYFVPTTAVAVVLHRLAGTSYITGARMAGAIWLSLATLLLYWHFGTVGLRRGSRFAIAVLPVIMPGILFYTATVSIDMPVLLMGSLVAVSVDRVVARRSRWWILPLVAATVILFKVTNVLAVVAGALVLLLSLRQGSEDPGEGAWWPRLADDEWRAARRQRLLGIGTMFVAAVAVAVAWMVVIRLRAVDPGPTPLDDRFYIASLGPTQFWSEISSGVWMGWVTGIYVADSWVAAWYSLAGIMLTSVSILPIFASGRDRRPAVTFGTAALTCLLLSGPLFVVVNFVLSHAWVPIPPRYAASVIPFGLVGMAHLTRTASKDRLVQGAAAVGLVGIFTTLLAVG